MDTAAARVLLVYGYEPSGHAAAAVALEEAGRAAGLTVSRVEVAGDHHPLAARAVARGYHALLRTMPAAWGALYRSDWARRVLRLVRAAYLSCGGAGRLHAGVRRAGADVVVCPQAAVAAVLAEARRRGELGVPVVSVLTDFGVHPFWADPPADLLVAPTGAAAARLRKLGVPEGRLRVCGLPIHPVFSAPSDRARARRLLGLPSAAPVVLVSGGSKGLGAVGEIASEVLRRHPRAIVLALCGSDDRLRRALCSADVGGRLRAFGPQPPAFVASLLAAADIHAGKPGGLSAAESLALGVPMALCTPLRGQEEENGRHLAAAGAAVRGKTPTDCARRCVDLLNDRGALAVLSAAAARAGRAAAAAAAIAEIRSWISANRRLTHSHQTGKINLNDRHNG